MIDEIFMNLKLNSGVFSMKLMISNCVIHLRYIRKELIKFRSYLPPLVETICTAQQKTMRWAAAHHESVKSSSLFFLRAEETQT